MSSMFFVSESVRQNILSNLENPRDPFGQSTVASDGAIAPSPSRTVNLGSDILFIRYITSQSRISYQFIRISTTLLDTLDVSFLTNKVFACQVISVLCKSDSFFGWERKPIDECLLRMRIQLREISPERVLQFYH